MMLSAAIAFALQPPDIQTVKSTELYNTSHKPVADVIERLPKTYADVKLVKTVSVEPNVPKLGPPLPGDLGAAYIQERPTAKDKPEDNPFRYSAGGSRRGAVTRPQAAPVDLPDPKQALQDKVRSSDLFFSLGSARQSSAQLTQSGPSDPFAELAAISGMASGYELTKDVSLNSAVSPDQKIYNSSELQSPRSPYQVMAGTLIPATLVTGLNSDLPGQVIGQVTENIHDTVTGRHLLVPQGAKLIGTYESRNSFGQTRAFVSWTRLIFPNGDSIVLDDLGAVDGQGFAGLRDKVDGHTGKLIKASVLSSVLGVGAELASNDDDRIIRALQNSGQQTLNVAGQRMVDRSLGVEPTITIRPGWRFSVLVSRDLILKPYSN